MSFCRYKITVLLYKWIKDKWEGVLVFCCLLIELFQNDFEWEIDHLLLNMNSIFLKIRSFIKIRPKNGFYRFESLAPVIVSMQITENYT